MKIAAKRLATVAAIGMIAASTTPASAQSRSEYYPFTERREFSMLCWITGGYSGTVTPGWRIDGRAAFAHARIGYGFNTADQAAPIENSIRERANRFGRSSPANGQIMVRLMDRCEREYPLR